MKLTRIHWTLFLLVMLLCLCTAAVCGADEIPENAATLTEGIAADAAVPGCSAIWFRFIPEETGAYTFYSGYSETETDIYGILYQRDGEEINLIDSNTRGKDDFNFRINKKLTAGKEYFLQVGFNADGDRVFPVKAERYYGLIAEQEGGQEDYYVQPGNQATLTVNASGGTGNYSYEWYRHESYSSSGTLIPDATGAIFTTEPITQFTIYSCIIRDDQESSPVKLMFFVQIDNQLQAAAGGNGSGTINANTGAPVPLTVEASVCSGSIYYQWYWMKWNGSYMDWAAIPGATEKTYYAQPDKLQSRYYCDVSDDYDSGSKSVYFTVNLDNHLTAEANGESLVTVTSGSQATLAVNASASDPASISYQWNIYTYHEDGTEGWVTVPGATEATWVTDSIDRNTRARCTVSDSYGSKSIDVTFEINIDNQLSAWIVGDSSFTVDAGSTVSMTVSASAANMNSIHYQWYEEYEGADGQWTQTLIPGATQAACTAEPRHSSTVYHCLVTDDYGGRCDNIRFYVNLDNHLTVEAAGDEDVSAEYGASATLEVSASATAGNIYFQWYKYEADEEGSGTWIPVPGATEASYTTEAVEKNTQYYCTVTDDFGSPGTSITFRVYVNNHLTAGPVGNTYVYVEPETQVTLEVDASATAGSIHYQWYKFGETAEGVWEDIPISGATGKVYTTEAMTGYTEYSCRVTDDFGSGACYVRFFVCLENNLEMWYVSDSPITVETGETATLSVGASVTVGEVSYQWYRYAETTEGEWTDILIPGATEASYTTEAVNQHTQYHCIAGDAYGSSSSLLFDVYPDYHLTAWAEGDAGITVGFGEEATMTVGASVSTGGIRYQWYKNTTDEYGNMNYTAVAGAVSPDFTTEPISGTDYYYCSVTDDSGYSTSVWFTVYPDNHFTVAAAGDISVAVSPGTTATLEVSASVSTGEIFFQWYKYAPGSNGMWDSIELPGATGKTYTTEAIGTYTSYYCNVTDSYGHFAQIMFYISVNNHLTAVVTGTDTNSTTVYTEPGKTETLSVSAGASAGNLHYQWYEQTETGDYVPISGATSETYTIGSVSAQKVYQCDVTDDYNSSTSVWFDIRVDNHLTAVASGTGQKSLTINTEPGKAVTLSVSASATAGSFRYQWYEQAGAWDYTPISGATSETYTTGAVTAQKNYYCQVTDDYGSIDTVWFYIRIENKLTAFVTGTSSDSADIHVAPGEAVTLSVTATVTAGSVHYQWVDDYASQQIEGAVQANYIIASVNRKCYYTCVVYDDYDNWRYIQFRVYVDSQLSASAEGSTDITLNPADVVTPTDLAPSPSALTVDADVGSGSLHYQWYYASDDWDEYGSMISGAVQAEYLPRRTGRYRCEVMDDYGNFRSVWFTVEIVNLTVYAAGNTNIVLTPGETADMQVDASVKSGEIYYAWYRRAESNLPVEGAAGRTCTAEAISGSAQYDCRVSDDYGNERTINFTVTVDNALRVVPATATYFSITKGSDVTMAVTATADSGTLTYEWQHEYRVNSWPSTEYISDVTGPSLVAENVQQSGKYICTVSDQYRNKVVVQFEVVVDNELTLTTEQESIQRVNRGDDLTLQVTANCNEGDITYSWEGGNSASGISSNTLVLENIQRNMIITCRATDWYGNEKKLTFLVLPDDISVLPAGQDFSVQIGTWGDIAILSFVPPTTGVYRFESAGGDDQTLFDSYVTLYDSQWNAIASDDESGYRHNFRLQQRLIANRQYYYGVNLISPSTGTVPLRMEQVSSEAPVLGLLSLKTGQSARIPANSEYGAFVSADSSDTSALSVSGNLLTAGGSGSGTLTVVYENVTATYPFEVLPAENSLHLPAALTTIESEAFSGDQQVKFAELGASVATVESGAFANTGLKQIVVQNPATVLKNGAFGSLRPMIICPAGSRAETFAKGNGYAYLNLP